MLLILAETMKEVAKIQQALWKWYKGHQCESDMTLNNWRATWDYVYIPYFLKIILGFREFQKTIVLKRNEQNL